VKKNNYFFFGGGAGLLALLSACAASVQPTLMRPPSWAANQRIWVDPKPEDQPFAGGDAVETIREAARELAGAGFEPGAPGEAATVVVKVSEEIDRWRGALNFSARLLLGERQIDQFTFDGKALSCHGSSMGTNNAPCYGKELAARIAGSPALAALHAAPPAPAAAPAAPAAHLSGRLAVLDLRVRTKDLTTDDARYFTDLVRTATLKHAPQMEVMTRENLLVLLQSTGKDLANCEGECEVDTGRRIGADAIVSGELSKIGTRYKLTLRLHETRQGRLVAAAVASGSTIDQLDDDANKATAALFEGTR